MRPWRSHVGFQRSKRRNSLMEYWTLSSWTLRRMTKSRKRKPMANRLHRDQTIKKRWNRSGPVAAFFVPLVLALSSLGQDLPDKIRGYKIYRDKASINAGIGASDASINIGEPGLVDVSLNGITFELPAEFTTSGESGRIEMVS